MPHSASSASVPANVPDTQEIFAVLHKWGIDRIGQLAALDREQLGERLGPEAVRLWDRATGKTKRLLKLVQPPESFEESFEFEREIETVEPLLFILRRFLEQLSFRLNAIYLVAKELSLRITFTNKKTYQHRFKIPQPTNEIDLLFRMLHTHLENFKSDRPIAAVSLTAVPIKPASQQFGLFETALRNPFQLSETLARLIALLGHDRVGTPVVADTYRPDSFRLEPFSWAAIESVIPHKRTGNAPKTAPAARPLKMTPALRRFRSPLSAIVFQEKNKPLHLQSPEIEGAISAQIGPYLSSGNWWDDKAWARAEWDVQLSDGMIVRLHQSGQKWEVDGIYD